MNNWKAVAQRASVILAETLLNEASNLDMTLKELAASINSIGDVYLSVETMLKRMFDNNGHIKGFGMLMGGQFNRWYQNEYWDKMQRTLYDLSKQAPTKALRAGLVQFLDTMATRHIGEGTASPMSYVFEDLLPLLYTEFSKVKGQYPAIFRSIDAWDDRQKHLAALIDELSERQAEDDLDDDEIAALKSRERAAKRVVSKQNNQAEEIVSSIIAQLPARVAGDVRNAIARAPNKLQALQQELKRRNINLGESKLMPINETASRYISKLIRLLER